MVANGQRRFVEVFSLTCARGDRSMISSSRFAECTDVENDEGDVDNNDVFIDDASLFKQSFH